MISCGNSNPSAATRTRRHVALANLFFQFLVTFVTVNIGAIAYVLPYSLKLLKLAPVVQKVDNAIHRINHYPLDIAIAFAITYPVDSDLSGG